MFKKSFATLMAATMIMGATTPSGQPARKEVTGDLNPPIPKGCQRYRFDGFECVAISKKSALKKYRKFLNQQ